MLHGVAAPLTPSPLLRPFLWWCLDRHAQFSKNVSKTGHWARQLLCALEHKKSSQGDALPLMAVRKHSAFRMRPIWNDTAQITTRIRQWWQLFIGWQVLIPSFNVTLKFIIERERERERNSSGNVSYHVLLWVTRRSSLLCMSRCDKEHILVQTVLLCISEVNSCGEVHIDVIHSCPVLADRNLSSVSIPG